MTDTAELRPARRIVHYFFSLISALCLLGLTPLLVLIFGRLLHLDDTRRWVTAEAAMPVMLLAAYPVFLFAALSRRRVLGVVSAFVVLSHVFFFGPELQLATRLPDTAKDAPHFTLLSHNVLFGNQTISAITQELKETDAEVVFLQEFTNGIYMTMKAQGAFDAYPYTSVNPKTGATGLGIFSKFPIRDAQMMNSPGFPQQRAVLQIGDRSVVAWNIHTQSPIVNEFSGWGGDLETLRQRLQAEHGDVLVAGDFNATWAHRPFRALVTNGYRDVAMDRGRGWTRTWPADNTLSRRVGGFIRIDHVLTRERLRPVSIEEGPGHGSDHRSLTTELVLLP